MSPDTPEALAALRAQLAGAEPGTFEHRMLELCVAGTELNLGLDLRGAVGRVLAANPEEAGRLSEPKIVGFLIGRVRAEAGGGDASQIRALLAEKALDSGPGSA